MSAQVCNSKTQFVTGWLFALGVTASLHLACPSQTSAQDAVLKIEAQRVAVMERVAPSVVAVFGKGGQGGGSGVLISKDGLALSNYHVTSGAGDFMKCGLNDGVLYDAVIIGIDPTGDVALLKLLGRDDFPHAKLGDSDAVRMGDWVFAMGNPFLLAMDFSPTVTWGIVSGTHRYQYPAGTFLEYTDCIQVDASINPGNSGGPLFALNGDLIGINGRGSFEKRGRVYSGAGYAISINQIRNFLDHLKSGRIVDHASFGATVATQNDGSVIVDQILETSDAYRRGLRSGHEIISFAGRPIRSVNQFKNILGIYPAGWKIPVAFRTEEGTREAFVRLPALHRDSEMAARPMQPQKKRPQRQRPGGPNPGDKPSERKPPAEPEDTGPPDKFKHMFVERDGFANYYFNSQERKRLMKSVARLGDFKNAMGTWIVQGKDERARPVEFVIADKAIGVTWAKNEYYQPVDSISIENEPQQCPGLLAGLRHLRMMLTGQIDKAVYIGSKPLDGQGDAVDVLLFDKDAASSRWLFNKTSGDVIGFDASFGPETDGCDFRFAKWSETEGRQFPSELQILSGGRIVATIAIDHVELRGGKK